MSAVTAVARPRSDARELERFVPYLLFRLSRRLNVQTRERMRHDGVTIHCWRVLSVLATKGPCSLKELSIFTVMEQSVISRVAEQMSRDGLVLRGERKSDRRVAELRPSPRGKALFARLWPVATQHGRRATDVLLAAEQRTLVRLLQKMLAAMDAEENV